MSPASVEIAEVMLMMWNENDYMIPINCTPTGCISIVVHSPLEPKEKS